MGEQPAPEAALDRNLVFGVLALQRNYLSRDALVAAMHGWVRTPTRALAEVLEERGHLTATQRQAIDKLVQEHLLAHRGDPGPGLASLGPEAQEVLTELSQDASFRGLLAAEDSFASLLSDDRPRSICRYLATRLHAQGGLGLVYVAEDTELRRQVALKEMQQRFADDRESRTRFLLEAEVTARLEHPGVVPVHGLGFYPDGRPYYAMRFIQGNTLKEAVQRFHHPGEARDLGERRLALRELLTRFAAVCKTAAYAHSRGVIHRDIKPANILLGPFGETLLVDWGLARFLDSATSSVRGLTAAAEATDSGTTQAGVAIGTPSYMSPEQAAGRHEEVGPASDIYSLGGTLYTLLTGEAPIEGKDVGLVIWRAQQGEIRPPRQVRGDVAPALEAICLKAMSRQPAQRYASALELAADVERWLADEPVRAWREPWTDRLRRWSRRHRTAVAAAGIILVAAVILLSFGTVLLRRQQGLTEQARQRADDNFQLARKAVEETIAKIEADPRLREADFSHLRQELLRSALPFYQQFVQQIGSDPALEAERAQVLQRLAHLRWEMGDPQGSLKDYEEVRRILLRLKQGPHVQQTLASCQHHLGILHQSLGRQDEGEAQLKEAEETLRGLVEREPGAREFRSDLGRTLFTMGVSCWEQQRFADARKYLEETLEIQQRLVQDAPGNNKYRRALGLALNQMAVLLRDLKELADSEQLYRQTVTLREQLVRDEPRVPEHRLDLARSQGGLARVLQLRDRLTEAAEAYRAALQTQDQLAAEYPTIPRYRQDLAVTLQNLGSVLVDRAQATDAEKLFRRSLEIRERLARDYPHVLRYRFELTTSGYNLAFVLRDIGRGEEALQLAQSAADELQRLVTEVPKDAQYPLRLAHTQLLVGELLESSEQLEPALDWFDRVAKTAPPLAKRLPGRAGEIQNVIGQAGWGRARLLSHQGQFVEALQELDRATPLLKKTDQAEAQIFRAVTLARARQLPEAISGADALVAAHGKEGGVLHDAAVVYSLAAAATSDEPARAAAYAMRAVQLLQQARDAGYFKSVARAGALKNKADFAPLRSRPDFGRLLKELEEK